MTASRPAAALRRLAPAAGLLGALALALGAGGCDRRDEGDAGSPPAAATPAERDAVRTAVVRLFRSSDIRAICEDSLTPRLFRRIFTGPAACRKVAADDEDDEPPKRVEVSHIQIREGQATAKAKLVGGDSAGAEGVVLLAKGKDGWRTDDFSTAFLRSLLAASLKEQEEIERGTGRCINRRLMRVSDAALKPLAYGLLGRRPGAEAPLLQLLSECERQRGGVSSVRRNLERSLRKTLRKAGADGTVTACALRRLRTTLPDALIIELAARDDRSSKARITREVVAAAVACGGGRRPAPGQLTPS